MEDCCHVCGDIGVEDATLTCSQCKTIRQHMYCMYPVLEEHIDDWVCEECEPIFKPNPEPSNPIGELPRSAKSVKFLEASDDGKLQGDSRKLPNESKKAPVNWEKKVATGKTKYISAEESMMLLKKEGPNVIPQSKNPRPKFGANKPERTKSKKLTDVLRSMSSLQPSQERMEKNMQKEQFAENKRIWPKEGSLKKKRPHASVPFQSAPPVTVSGANDRGAAEQRSGNTENVNNNILPDIQFYSRTPALDPLWKGSFSIQDDHRRKELNHQIQAHPPSHVRRKIYEFSMKMPKLLHFELVSSEKLWVTLFAEYIPDERDIALYFFPCVGERCNVNSLNGEAFVTSQIPGEICVIEANLRSEDYVSLMESITAKKLALRKQIGDVELLVFSSKLLPVNCQCREGKYFLWGVFHRQKQDVEPQDDVNVEPQDDVDMEIDMIGGVDVGRIDVPVQRSPHKQKCESFRQGPATSTDPGPEKQISSIPRLDSAPAAVAPSIKNVKVEPYCDIPPGFEEKAKALGTRFNR